MSVPNPLVTADNYLAFERQAEERHQFIDGQIFAMAGESLNHSTICMNIGGELRNQLKSKSCRTLSPNMKIRTGPMLGRSTKGMFSYADVTVVCGEPQFHDRFQDVLLNPTLIVEVLSPSTEAFDRGDKFYRYRTQLDSLTDFLFVATSYPMVEHYARGEAGQWLYTPVTEWDGVLELPNLGCRLALSEIYDRVVFPVEDAGDPL